jgi:peptidase E
MKYILHGGVTSDESLLADNKKFFHEMIKDFVNPKILIVYFARKKEEYPQMLKDDTEIFQQSSPGKKIEIQIAEAETFEEQARQADIIYVRGGDTTKLIELIKTISNFVEAIKGKVYGGSSAGAYLVSKYYYSNNADEVMQGLGILPIKVFCHWQGSLEDKLKKLASTGEDMPIYKLAEGQFVILEF